MKKKKMIIGSSIVATATAGLVGVATWIVGGLVYDGSVGKDASVKSEDMVEFYSNREDKVLDKLANYEHETVFVNSEVNGYKLETLSIQENEKTTDEIIVFH